MSDVPLLPMTDAIGDVVFRHGERGTDLDPVHPQACLCGQPFYLACEGYLADDTIESLVLYTRRRWERVYGFPNGIPDLP